MGPDGSADLAPDTDDTTYCARHPQVETTLACARCGTLICPRCLVQSPVGARCPTCANVSRLPTIDVSPVYLLRGVGAATASGAAAGTVWGYAFLGFFGFLIIFIGLGIGWAVSEAVSLATNRKRAIALQAIAIGGCVLAYFVRNIVAGVDILPANDAWGYVAAGVAAFYANSRLRF